MTRIISQASAIALGAAVFISLSSLSVAFADAPASTHYVLDPAKSSLEFNFSQAGAQNKGHFKQLAASLDFSPDNLATAKLDVTIEMGSLDSGDQERDDTLRGADLFAVAKFKQAHFSAAQIVKIGRAHV